MKLNKQNLSPKKITIAERKNQELQKQKLIDDKINSVFDDQTDDEFK